MLERDYAETVPHGSGSRGRAQLDAIGRAFGASPQLATFEQEYCPTRRRCLTHGPDRLLAGADRRAPAAKLLTCATLARTRPNPSGCGPGGSGLGHLMCYEGRTSSRVIDSVRDRPCTGSLP